jgi:feruloyl esterase
MGLLILSFRELNTRLWILHAILTLKRIIIRSGSSLWYYEHVRSYFKKADLSDKYRLFMLPGVGHCGGGPGADAFGGPGQGSISQGSSGQSLLFDAEHDMILATMKWVEKGIAPKSLVGAKYINSNQALGTAFTRLFCPYPQASDVP